MNKNKKILMICYYYPPLADVGSKRSVAFSKYFKKYGWTPYVLSVKNPDKNYCIIGNENPPSKINCEYAYSIFNAFTVFGKINGLLTRLARLFGIEIRRNYFYDIFCIPDIFLGWIPFAFFKGYILIKKNDIDFIYNSCPPHSSLLIGVLLKLVVKKPLISDFRNPYAVGKTFFYYLPTFRKILNRYIEKVLLSYTDIFIVLSDDMKNAYIKQYKELTEKIFVIHNGIDSNLIEKTKNTFKFSKFSIFYCGQYFYNEKEWSPEFFFKALNILKTSDTISYRNFQFLYYGRDCFNVEKLAKKYEIEEFVKTSSYIPHKELLKIASQCHLYLLRNRELVIPAKLYEGISLNVPFLATIPPGESEEIIKRYSPSSYIITEESAIKVADAIIDAMEKYNKNMIIDNNDQEFLSKYSKERSALDLKDILENTVIRFKR